MGCLLSYGPQSIDETQGFCQELDPSFESLLETGAPGCSQGP